MPIGIYIRTEATRKSLSIARKKNPSRYWLGKKRLDMIGEKNPAKRAEVRAKITRSLKDRPCKRKGMSNYWLAGDKSPFWKDGRSIGKNRQEYIRKKALDRIARKHNAEGTHTSEEWEKLKEIYDFMYD